MADRLVVDTTAVRDAATALNNLKAELDSAQDLTEDARTDLADAELAEALDDFATNWRHHRGKITASMERMAGVAAALADTLDEVDRALAAAARGEPVGSTPAVPEPGPARGSDLRTGRRWLIAIRFRVTPTGLRVWGDDSGTPGRAFAIKEPGCGASPTIAIRSRIPGRPCGTRHPGQQISWRRE